jgi:hypothetical protein
MFEPQDHPNDFLYPGGPPVRPYDAAGWTPAYTMGIEFDRILDDFTGPFETIAYGELQKPVGQLKSVADKKVFTISVKENDAFIVINDLLKAGIAVMKNKISFIVPINAKSTSIIQSKTMFNHIILTNTKK